eukprot:13830569-Ditylum_brightwellii.AAC.1
MTPHTTNHLVTMRQLGSAGLVTAVNISRQVYSHQMSYNSVWRRYKCITKLDFDENIDVKKQVRLLLEEQFEVETTVTKTAKRKAEPYAL